MKKKFDIIVIANNNCIFLDKCLDSTCNQTFNDYNVIIIDSSDNINDNANIAQKYHMKNNNIYYYPVNIGKQNIIKFAISKVESDFFLFVNSNDYVSVELLEKLNTYCMPDIDVIGFSLYRSDEFNTYNYPLVKKTFSEVSGKEAILLLNDPNYAILFDIPFGYIYRTNFFKDNVNININEYRNVAVSSIICANKVISIDFFGYYCVETNHKLNKEDIVSKLRYFNFLDSLYKSYDFNEHEINLLYKRIIFSILDISGHIHNDNIKFFTRKLKEMQIYKIIPKNSITNKIYRLLFKNSPILLIIFYISYANENKCGNFSVPLQSFFRKMRLDCKESEDSKLKEQSNESVKISRIFKFIISLIINSPILLSKNYIYLDSFELCISTMCNLKCKNCSNLMPLYKTGNKNRAINYNISNILKQVRLLLNCIDYVDNFKVLGGEPFLHPNLDRIIEVLVVSKKVNKVIIATNGSIIPQNPSLLAILKNNKVYVNISNYSVVQDKTQELIKLLEKENINILLYKSLEDNYWLDYGKAIIQNKTKEELSIQFSKCSNIYKSTNMLDGKIYVCPRSAHLKNLDITKDQKSEYVDILDCKISNLEKRKRILKLLYGTKYVNACNYCNVGTCNIKRIETAQQL